MNIFQITVRAAAKRPFIPVMIGILMLAGAVINIFIPVIPLVIGIVRMTGANVLESFLSLIQMLVDPGIIPNILIGLGVMTVLGSIAAGLLLPGYLKIVEDGLKKGPKEKGLMAAGLKQYFLRFFLMTLETAFLALTAAAFLLISSVPAIVVTRAAVSTKPDLMIAALFIDLVTAGVFFFSLAFLKTYILMWYIAASKGLEKPFAAGKKTADSKFWNLTVELLIFDIVIAAGLFLIYLSDSQIFRYAAGWLFTTAFFTTLVVYLVRAYEEKT